MDQAIIVFLVDDNCPSLSGMPEHHLTSGMATPDGPSSSGLSHGLLMPACW